MIHSDLMLVVVEVLIVLDLEPPRPLPGIILLTGFAEHAAHSVPSSHVVPRASGCTMCHNVLVTRSESLLSSGQCSDPARPVRPPVMLGRKGELPLIISQMQLMLS